MRGNEQNDVVRPWVLEFSFPIPMRGNETAVRNNDDITLDVPDPHEGERGDEGRRGLDVEFEVPDPHEG